MYDMYVCLQTSNLVNMTEMNNMSLVYKGQFLLCNIYYKGVCLLKMIQNFSKWYWFASIDII